MASQKTKLAGNAGPAFDHAAIVYNNYNNMATNSWEQIFSPINIEKGGTSATPGFRPPQATSEGGMFAGSCLGPTVRELDPYFSSILGHGTEAEFFEKTDYRIITTLVDSGPLAPAPIDLNKDELLGDVTAVRTNGLRGPLIMSGWGFGIDDLPVPAKGSSYPGNVSLDPSAVGNRVKWKTGPVNLMWDDERQVWQGGYQVVCGIAMEPVVAPSSPCTPAPFLVRVFRNTKHRGGRLSTVLGETITVKNRDVSLEQEFKENAIFVIAIRLNYEWIPIWVGCPEEPVFRSGQGELHRFSGPPACII